MSNLVHTYVTGNSFPNIFGGHTPSMYGSITHITHMTPLMQQRWPWLKDQWSLDNARGYTEYFSTLKEAKARAAEWWPGCGFKTPAQFGREA